MNNDIVLPNTRLQFDIIVVSLLQLHVICYPTAKLQVK